jgi:hypothetical protein
MERPANSSPPLTRKRIFVDRNAIRETEDCKPIVVLDMDTKESHATNRVEISGPSVVVFDPRGFRFRHADGTDAVIRAWMETESPVK